MKLRLVILIFAVFAVLTVACTESEDVAVEAISSVEDIGVKADDIKCESNSSLIAYLCGPINGEDILQLGDSQWLLVSGMNGELMGGDENGKLHLVDHVAKSYEVIFPSENAVIEQDMTQFSDCPGPIDVSNISIHGLSLKANNIGPDQYHLYVTSHGVREAIEVFEVDAFLKPEVKWVGCIMMPESSWTNSVSVLDDGGFYATQFMESTGQGIENVNAGEITGHVFEWHPKGEIQVVAGTELSGANGILVSEDERWLFVAEFGTHKVVRFDTHSNPMRVKSAALNIAPDNLRWSSDGTIYTAGNFVAGQCFSSSSCDEGWGVFEIDPATMKANIVKSIDGSEIMGDASSALLVGEEIWVGTYSGGRLGILLKH